MANKVDSLAEYARLSHLPSGFFLNVFEIPMGKYDGYTRLLAWMLHESTLMKLLI